VDVPGKDKSLQGNDGEKKTAIIDPSLTLASAAEKISGIVFEPFRKGWVFGFFIAFVLLNVLFLAATYLFIKGVGIWGIKIPVGWGFAIINFVWWIGIGHAGTFISAFLILLRQKWRTSINRFAEAMTLFAVACAGLFPILHLGRPVFFYWLMPYPNTMGLWPQFRSPLIWDVFAVLTYFTVSLLFWYVGLLPDLAVMRDRAGISGSNIFMACSPWAGAETRGTGPVMRPSIFCLPDSPPRS